MYGKVLNRAYDCTPSHLCVHATVPSSLLRSFRCKMCVNQKKLWWLSLSQACMRVLYMADNGFQWWYFLSALHQHLIPPCPQEKERICSEGNFMDRIMELISYSRLVWNVSCIYSYQIWLPSFAIQCMKHWWVSWEDCIELWMAFFTSIMACTILSINRQSCFVSAKSGWHSDFIAINLAVHESFAQSSLWR